MESVITIHPTAIYSSDDVCAMLDVSPQALTVARRSGELKSARKGRRVVYLGEWLLEWLRSDDNSAQDDGRSLSGPAAE